LTQVHKEAQDLETNQGELLSNGRRTCSGKGFVIFQRQRGALNCAHDHRRVNIDNLLEKLVGQQSMGEK